MNTVSTDEEIETPCPICGDIGIYKKFADFDLLRDHLIRAHTKKHLAVFLCEGAYISRLWDMDEATCKQKWFDGTMDLMMKSMQALKERGPE